MSLGQVNLSQENVAAIQEGMLAVTPDGLFGRRLPGPPLPGRGQDGSAQVTGEENANAVLVCFAPYDDPQIALAIVAEQGGSGSALGTVAAQTLSAWAGKAGL